MRADVNGVMTHHRHQADRQGKSGFFYLDTIRFIIKGTALIIEHAAIPFQSWGRLIDPSVGERRISNGKTRDKDGNPKRGIICGIME